jgi:hypothetical protein
MEWIIVFGLIGYSEEGDLFIIGLMVMVSSVLFIL